MSHRPSSLRPPTDDSDSQQQHYPSRLHSQSHGGGQLTPSQLRMRDKQRELEAFKKVLIQSKELVAFYEQFGDKFDVLGGGSEAVAGVVEHWQNVFRVTHLALASLETKKVPTSPDDDTPILPPGTLPDRLVRIPVEPAAQFED